jgi:hypothetical protein
LPHYRPSRASQQLLAALVKSEIARWTPIIKAARIKAGKARAAGVSTIFEQAPRLHIPQEEHDESA